MFMVLVGLGLALAAGVAFILLTPPIDFIRDQAIAQVRQQTGRDLVISGPTRLSFYPSLGVSLGDVSLSAPPGMDGAPLVAMEKLDLSVKLVPLLSRRVEVGNLVLTRPQFNLRVDQTGRTNWEMAVVPATDKPLRYAQAGAGTNAVDGATTWDNIRLAQRNDGNPQPFDARRSSRLAALQDLALDDVRIVDGAINYVDERNGTHHNASAINMALSADNLAAPLAVEGDLAWRGQTVSLKGSMTSLAEVLADAPAKLALTMSAAPLRAEYSGVLDLANGASLNGAVSADAASLRALALWVGDIQLPPGDGFGALSFKGQLVTQPGRFRLANADIGLDHMRITGTLDGEKDATHQRPYVKASLAVSEINLNTYLPTSAQSAPSPTRSPDEMSGDTSHRPPAPAAGQPSSIEDLLERERGPRVKGYTARRGWSDEVINLSLLDLIDADLDLSVGTLLVRDIKVGRSDLKVALNRRLLKVTSDRVEFYGGRGRGEITINSAATPPAMRASIVAEDISAEPLMKDAAEIDWLSGTGRLSVDTASSGDTQRKLISSLNGKASIQLNDGAVKGFDVTKALTGLQQGRLNSFSANPSEQTRFSKLSATFDIDRGIANNQDLEMLSPLLRVTGHGKAMLPDRRVDYVFNPKLIAPNSEQEQQNSLYGLQIPVRVVGPWDRPDIKPDLSKINAEQAVQAVQEIGKRLKGKNANEVVDEIFGKDSKESKKAKKFLDDLFR